MQFCLRFFLALVILLPTSFTFAQQKKNKPPKKDQLAIIHTKFGDVVVRLYDDTPAHKANFIKLAEEGLYDSTTFHRVMKEFMVQGGDPYSKDPAKKNQAGNGGPGYTLDAEILPQYFHKRGALAAARQPDAVNPQRKSSGSQFYIVQGRTFTDAELARAEQNMRRTLGPDFTYTDTAKTAYKEAGGSPWLDQQYSIFGEVISGMEVVDKIADQKVSRGNNRPTEDIVMAVEIVEMKRKKIVKQYGDIYGSR